jgi:hypothetical protein
MLQPSVIIPARNRSAILPDTLRALARQSFPPELLEVVVIDDGSTDDTAAVIQQQNYPFRLVYERLEPQAEFCPARPRNHGLRVATGDIVLLLDADIVACPDLVAQHLAVHAAAGCPQGVIGYSFGYTAHPEDRTPEVLCPPPPDRILEELPDLIARDPDHWQDGREPIYSASHDLADHPAPWQCFWTHNVSLPRHLALAIGGFDEEFVGWGVEDLEFAYRLCRQGVRLVLARGACGVHYPHPLGEIEQRRMELERNRRRLIAKHPGPQLELRLWDARVGPPTWPEVEALLRHPPRLTTVQRDVVPALFAFMQAEVLAPGPVLWCGDRSVEWRSGAEPAAVCWPCVPDAGEDSGVAPPPVERRETPSGIPSAGQTLPLLGIYTPWDDATFTAGIVLDYWRSLPPVLLEGLLRELTRVAQCAVLLCTDAAPPGEWGCRLQTEDYCHQVLASLPPVYELETVRYGSASAFLVYQPPWRGQSWTSADAPSFLDRPASHPMALTRRGGMAVAARTHPEVSSANGAEPILETIKEALLHTLDERLDLDDLTEAVLHRLQTSHAIELPATGVAPHGTVGSDPSCEELPISSSSASLALPEAAEALVVGLGEPPPSSPLVGFSTTDSEDAAPDAPGDLNAGPTRELTPEEIDLYLAEEGPPAVTADAIAGSPVGQGHPLVAPFGTRLCAQSWQGRLPRKPWEYPITAVIPHMETAEPLRACVELLRLQTQRPYLMVIDTGSSESAKAALEAMRAEDLEVHCISAHGYRHVSGAVDAAQDLAFALCRSEYLYCTHADCFLRRRDYLEWLLSLCGPDRPAVGYQMSPRDWLTDLWQGMVSHTATLLHMPTMRRLGVTWSIERSCEQFGMPRAHSSWPDTETCMNLCLRAAGVQPFLIGNEENFKRHLDENVDHIRSFPGSRVYGPEYHAKAQVWMEGALREAWQRVSLWKAADFSNSA